MANLELSLLGGHHVGPLFTVSKIRAPQYSLRSAARFRFLRRRTPAWADQDLLLALKKLKRIYTITFNERYTEDHVVPLRHPLVCGLHCPDNIELMLEVDNLAKSNRWWPDMPETQTELF